jgi:alpha-ribazole phosphatase
LTHTTLDFLRHGEPVGGNKYRGQIDDPLSERGWEQMWHAASGATPWQRVVTSPLARCREFAEALAHRLDLPVTVDARLREIGFGSWEGRTSAELKASDPDMLRRFYHDPVGQRPVGAESAADFTARVGEAIEQLLAAHHGMHLLVVAHAGVIRAAVGHALGAPPERLFRTKVDNAAFTRLRATRERPLSLLFHNRTPL